MTIDVNELEEALRSTDPAVCLVPARVLRRVIKHDRRLIGLGLRVPHDHSYVLSREALLRRVERDELGLAPERELPQIVILLARPEVEELQQLGRDGILVRYWRLLFHARIHQALEQRIAQGRLTDAGIRHRIQCLGATEFDAARAALREENDLLPPRDDRTTYIEFVARYLELRAFAPTRLRDYFPGITDLSSLDTLIGEDVDAAGLLVETRPAGAPAPTLAVAAVPTPMEVPEVEAPSRISDNRYRDFVARAARARARGNLVRAALWRMKAVAVASPKVVRAARNAARAELNALVDRLVPALALTDEEAKSWRQHLPALLAPAARGVWPVEARLLFDLQKVCLYERDLYAADLVEWAMSMGRRPIKRPLPTQREVLLLQHLRRAEVRLTTSHIPDIARRALARLFEIAIHRREEELRRHFRPVLEQVLDEVGLVPRNLPERVARTKLVEELLDHAAEHGYLTMGDLRDALSGSQLKLPDLRGPGELLAGDRLLRANTRLAIALDGVYHRGEIYLRWLQRLSALAFGTRAGRIVTLFLVLPFGGAYFILEGLQHMINPVLRLVIKLQHLAHEEAAFLQTGTDAAENGPPPEPSHPGEVYLSTSLGVGLFGLFLFLLLHLGPFRRVVVEGLVLTARALHTLVVRFPSFLLHWPPLHSVLHSQAFALVWYYLIRPGAIAGLGWLGLGLGQVGPPIRDPVALGVFLGSNLLLNSRQGRALEEIVTDWLAQAWHRLNLEVVPALVHFFIDVFKRFLGGVDRLLYAVDEWLRFHTGESRWTFVVKTLLGLIWFVVAYLVRMTVILFVEPTVNPVKHFPTVTVAAKLILPLFPMFVDVFATPLLFLGPVVANACASTVFLLFPGLAGFFVWELKENWRLYTANRARTLRPVVIGSHGETMARLLRPGFHSGTLPKLYAKLRRAERRSHAAAAEAARKCRAGLHHVEECLRRFLERELVALVNASSFWRGTPLVVENIELGSNRIRAALACAAVAPGAVWLSFEERSGWLLAGASGPGWLPCLSPEQRQALATALAGLYKLAGVDLVRTQVEAALPASVSDYDVVEEGLVVWSGAHFDAEALYPLGDSEASEPRVTMGTFADPLPVLSVAALVFGRAELTWAWWVQTWEGDQAGKPHQALPGGAVPLL